MSKNNMEIHWIKWWNCKEYKNGISITDWNKAYDRIELHMFAIVMFHPKENEKLSSTNGGKCAYAIGKSMYPIGSKEEVEKRAKELEEEAYQEALIAKDFLIKTGHWPDFTRSEGAVAVS